MTPCGSRMYCRDSSRLVATVPSGQPIRRKVADWESQCSDPAAVVSSLKGTATPFRAHWYPGAGGGGSNIEPSATGAPDWGVALGVAKLRDADALGDGGGTVLAHAAVKH